MKKIFTIIISGGLFGALGALIGYKYAKNKYLAIADKEIESVLQSVKNANKKEIKPVTLERKVAKVEETKDTKVPTDYSKLYNPEEAKIKEETIVKTKDIYIISDDDFARSENNIETIKYFGKDRYVTDHEYNCLPNFSELIGPFELWEKELKINENVVYVRNESTSIDYEVLYVDDSWTEVASPEQKAAALIEVNSKCDDD